MDSSVVASLGGEKLPLLGGGGLTSVEKNSGVVVTKVQTQGSPGGKSSWKILI